MNENRPVICKRCHKDFNYQYHGGGVKQICSECKPWKKKKNASRDSNAYGFSWGRLRYPWRPTKKGNPGRFMGQYRLILYTSCGRFVFSLMVQGNWIGWAATIGASKATLQDGLDWAEECAQGIIDSLEARQQRCARSSVG